jgi:hypothetical protein
MSFVRNARLARSVSVSNVGLKNHPYAHGNVLQGSTYVHGSVGSISLSDSENSSPGSSVDPSDLAVLEAIRDDLDRVEFGNLTNQVNDSWAEPSNVVGVPCNDALNLFAQEAGNTEEGFFSFTDALGSPFNGSQPSGYTGSDGSSFDPHSPHSSVAWSAASEIGSSPTSPVDLTQEQRATIANEQQPILSAPPQHSITAPVGDVYSVQQQGPNPLPQLVFAPQHPYHSTTQQQQWQSNASPQRTNSATYHYAQLLQQHRGPAPPTTAADIAQAAARYACNQQWQLAAPSITAACALAHQIGLQMANPFDTGHEGSHRNTIYYPLRRLVLTGQDTDANMALFFGPRYGEGIMDAWHEMRLRAFVNPAPWPLFTQLAQAVDEGAFEIKPRPITREEWREIEVIGLVVAECKGWGVREEVSSLGIHGCRDFGKRRGLVAVQSTA